MSNLCTIDELRACFKTLRAGGVTEWKTEVVGDLIVDYIPPCFQTPCGEGYINSKEEGCFVVSSYDKEDADVEESGVTSDDDDSYLRECEGYNDVIFETDAMITDHLQQRKRYISQSKQMVINCGEYAHLNIPQLQNTEKCPYFHDKVIYESYCDTHHVFKPLCTKTGQALVPLLKSLHLVQDCLVCFRMEDTVYFLLNQETDTDVELLSISTAPYHVTDSNSTIRGQGEECTIQCVYSRYSTAPDLDTSVPHLSIQCIWKHPYQREIELLCKPPYNSTAILHIRCVPGDACGKHYAAYTALLTLSTRYKECDLTSGHLINKIDKLLRCEGLETNTQPDLQTLGTRSDFDLTEQLYVLLCKVPDLHQQECLKHVLDYISQTSNIIPDINTENDTSLAKLIVSANDSPNTKRSIKDQVKSLTLSSNWTEEMMLELGVYKLLNDYIHYFKSYDDNLQYHIQNHFYSQNGLEKLHYIVELITAIDSIFDMTQQMMLRIINLLLDTCLKQNFNLIEVPTFRIVLPSTSTFNQAKQEIFDKMPMVKWSCYSNNEKKCSKTILALVRNTNENIMDASESEADCSVEELVKWEIIKSNSRKYLNIPVYMEKHLKNLVPNHHRTHLTAM